MFFIITFFLYSNFLQAEYAGKEGLLVDLKLKKVRIGQVLKFEGERKRERDMSFQIQIEMLFVVLTV